MFTFFLFHIKEYEKNSVFGLGDMGAAITHRLLKKNFKVISTKRGKYMDFIENNSFSVMANPCDVVPMQIL